MSETKEDVIAAYAGLIMAALIHRRGMGSDPSTFAIAEMAVEAAAALVTVLEEEQAMPCNGQG